ncbi:MAG: winged helix-turn-helix transcriptional regulator, partial [Bradyrhizobium sp.]
EHKKCGKLFDPVMVCSECGEPLLAREVVTHPGPGARKPATSSAPERPAKAKPPRTAA